MADDAPPKKKSKLKWIILLLILLLLGGGGAAAWFLFLQDKFMPKEDPDAQPEQVQSATIPPVGVTVPLPVFTTNLADPLGQRFIRISMEVEVADPSVVELLAKQNARIRDAILMLLSSKTYADIASTESKLILKSEITERLNTILGPGKVFQVFVTDMVIQ